MPIVALAFIAYAMLSPHLPPPDSARSIEAPARGLIDAHAAAAR